ncbi:MAG: hypothetical protein K8Q92_03985 [Methylophilales bacterium]|nr:hypothetical protein [Methylophilales bacterium]
MSGDSPSKDKSLADMFGLDREMGYTRQEFFRLLPIALSGFDFSVNEDGVNVTILKGGALVHVGVERERRLSDLVQFPVLPVSIRFKDVDKPTQMRFMQQFNLSYLKGLG